MIGGCSQCTVPSMRSVRRRTAASAATISRLRGVHDGGEEVGVAHREGPRPDAARGLAGERYARGVAVVPRGDAIFLVIRELEGSNAKYRCTCDYAVWGEGVSGEGIIARRVCELPIKGATMRVGY